MNAPNISPDWLTSLLKHARRAGLGGRRILLILLAGMAFAAMVFGVKPIAAVGAAVVFYLLDTGIAFARNWGKIRQLSAEKSVVEAQITKQIRGRRKVLKMDEPELPFDPPHSDQQL